MTRPTITLILLVILSCSEDAIISKHDNLIGLWVPYEIVTPDRQIQGPFTASSIFGFYAESIQFNAGDTYFPAVWTDKNNYFTYEHAGGNYEHKPTIKKIILTEGQWEVNFDVIKFSNDDLWIQANDTTYKLKKER